MNTAPAPRTPPTAWSRVDLAAGGLALDLGLYAVSALFAAFTATGSTLTAHRAWGALALWGYAAATLAVVGQLALRRCGRTRLRALLTGMTWLAVAVVPLVAQAVARAAGHSGRAQEEVLVVEDSARRLIEGGTPYLSRDAIGGLAEPLLGYTPYQPLMSVFGLPRAALGTHWWTDARVWFAVVTAAAVLGAVRLLRDGTDRTDALLVRAVQAVTVLPLCALTIATGGDDLPVLALCLLALALAARGRSGAAGLAVGLAAAMKLFAWPVAVVLGLHLLTRGGLRRYALGALGLPLLALAPALLADAGSVAENVVRFPTGHGLVTSPAASPLLGKLITDLVPGGRTVALVLLACAALALGVRLLRRPPREVRDVAVVSAIGLLVAIMLMPATRFGYLLYPAALALWAPALSGEQRLRDGGTRVGGPEAGQQAHGGVERGVEPGSALEQP